MKTVVMLAAASLFFSAGAFAQSSPPPSYANVPPPPGMNDPGVQPAAPPPAAAPPAPAPVPRATSRDALPTMQDPGTAGDEKHMTLPQVAVRQEGENQVQEYSRGGAVYMVVVTPLHGPQQTYMVDPDGTRHLQPGEPPVQPAMYKVLEWGKSKPAEADSSGSASDGG